MSPDYLAVGDTIADSPVGPGTISDVTDAGYPQVDGVAVVWVKRTDGILWDPLKKYNQTIARRAQNRLAGVSQDGA